MNAYERVLAARHKSRPTAMRYIEALIEDFVEMHGDRRFGDDAAGWRASGGLRARPLR